jgi:hypothetical protein
MEGVAAAFSCREVAENDGTPYSARSQPPRAASRRFDPFTLGTQDAPRGAAPSLSDHLTQLTWVAHKHSR